VPSFFYKTLPLSIAWEVVLVFIMWKFFHKTSDILKFLRHKAGSATT